MELDDYKSGKRRDSPEVVDDIYDKLCKVIGGEKYVQEQIMSPYFHFMDFEVAFDSAGNPVQMAPEGNKRFSVIRYVS